MRPLGQLVVNVRDRREAVLRYKSVERAAAEQQACERPILDCCHTIDERQALETLRHAIGDKAFFDATRLLVYDRTDPAPGNFKPVYRTTPDFIRFVNQVTGKDWQWFFDAYVYQAALPKLIRTQSGEQVTLRWQVPGNKVFPLPVEVQVGDRIEILPMANGSGSVAVPEGVNLVVDPMSRILMQSDQVDAYQAYRAVPRG